MLKNFKYYMAPTPTDPPKDPDEPADPDIDPLDPKQAP